MAMTRYYLTSVLLCTLLFCPFTPLDAKNRNSDSRKTPDSGKIAAIDSIMQMYNNPNGPGAALAVIENGEIVLTRSWGLANLEYDIPVTPSTVFHIASVSKQFTVFAIMLLQEQGKLSLDDDIRKHIPEVPDFGHTITLRHLASHTGGLRDQWSLLTMSGWRMDDVITTAQVMKLTSRQKELNFAPGEEYFYSNTGFTLLAEVVARVSEKSFAEFCNENIFEPLQMHNTLFYDDHQKIVKNRAYSYQPHGEGYKKSNLNYATVGATSLFTTVEDLSLWAMNFQDPKVGTPEIFRIMSTPTVLNNGEEIEGALGQFVRNHKGLLLIDHGGADAGFRTYFGRFPEEDLAVILFTNMSNADIGLARDVADLFLADKITETDKEDQPDLSEEITLPIEALDAFTGLYENNDLPGMLYRVTRKEKRLQLASPGQRPSALLAVTPVIFTTEDKTQIIEFAAAKNENPAMLSMKTGSRVTKATAITPYEFTTEELKQYEGTYYSPELSTWYDIVWKNEGLKVKHYRLPDFSLTPMTLDTLAGNFRNLARISFERDEKGNITGFRSTSGRVQNLWFEKVR